MRIPAILKWATWLTFFNTWVLFEETIVDRHGLWEYLPYSDTVGPPEHGCNAGCVKA